MKKRGTVTEQFKEVTKLVADCLTNDRHYEIVVNLHTAQPCVQFFPVHAHVQSSALMFVPTQHPIFTSGPDNRSKLSLLLASTIVLCHMQVVSVKSVPKPHTPPNSLRCPKNNSE